MSSRSTELRELTRLTIIDVVDNDIDNMTSPCRCCNGDEDAVGKFKNEFSSIIERTKTFDLSLTCNAAHGLSLLLIAEYVDEAGKNQEERLLFDAGPQPEIWSGNAAKLNLNLAKIDTAVLSHYHIDHSGGFRSAVWDICNAKAAIGVESDLWLDFHKSQVTERGFKSSKSATIVPCLPTNPSKEELEESPASVILEDEGHTVASGCVFVSGYIPRETSYETGLPNHYTKVDGDWVEDSEIADERYIACKIKGRGIVVFSACSHAGIVNVCRDAISQLNGRLTAVVGGFHLSGHRLEERIESTVNDLKELSPDLILAGHCTGWRAKAKFADAFEDTFQPLSVGAKYTLNSM